MHLNQLKPVKPWDQIRCLWKFWKKITWMLWPNSFNKLDQYLTNLSGEIPEDVVWRRILRISWTKRIPNAECSLTRYQAKESCIPEPRTTKWASLTTSVHLKGKSYRKSFSIGGNYVVVNTKLNFTEFRCWIVHLISSAYSPFFQYLTSQLSLCLV